MQGVLRVAITLAVIYGLWGVALFVFQRSLIYPGRSRGAPAGVRAPDTEVHWLPVGAAEVEMWVLPARGEPRGRLAVVVAHGNGELIDDWPPLVESLRRLGCLVALVEFPGYGRSGGTPTESSIVDTMVAAYDVVAARADVSPERIIGCGRSLGAGAVCGLAARRDLAALVLLSPVASVRAFAARYLLPGFLVRDPFDNVPVVRQFGGPVLVAHGRQDATVPYAHGLRLYEAAALARILSYDAGHNDCPPDWDRLWTDTIVFLRDHGIHGED